MELLETEKDNKCCRYNFITNDDSIRDKKRTIKFRYNHLIVKDDAIKDRKGQ